jgi:hypothetical protein
MAEIWNETFFADGAVERVFIGFTPVPPQIQMWQARAMLIRMGLIDQVNDAVAASGNREIQNAWEFAPNVVRRSAFLLAMAAALGLSDETLDNLFIEGSRIR